MHVETLLREIEERGAQVALDGENICIQGARVLSDELRTEIRALKPEIVAVLRECQARGREYSAPPEEARTEGRGRVVRAFHAGAAYVPTLAMEEAWRAWLANEVTLKQRDNLLAYARRGRPPRATPEACARYAEDDVRRRYAPILALAHDERAVTLPASLRAVVRDAAATAQRIIEAEAAKPWDLAPDPDEMRLLGDMLGTLDAMMRAYCCAATPAEYSGAEASLSTQVCEVAA